jgi:hypothetical protein
VRADRLRGLDGRRREPVRGAREGLREASNGRDVLAAPVGDHQDDREAEVGDQARRTRDGRREQ